MKRLLVLALLMITVLSFGSIQRVNAGGSAFTTLSFPNANRRSCGFWQVSGGGGQAASNWVAMYSLLDGTGRLLANGAFTQFPLNGTIKGTFAAQPKANPIHFVAVAYYRGDVYNIGDLYADNPCLPPSIQATPTFVPTIAPSTVPSLAPTTTPINPPTFVPSLVPTTTPINPLTLTPPPTITPTPLPSMTPIAPNVWIGCSQTLIEGYIVNPVTPYIRATVNLASNLNVQLASQVVPLTGNNYNVTLTYPVQAVGTRLIVAVGEWDGANYIHPAYLVGGDCIFIPTPPTSTPPVPVPTNTLPPFTPVPTTMP